MLTKKSINNLNKLINIKSFFVLFLILISFLYFSINQIKSISANSISDFKSTDEASTKNANCSDFKDPDLKNKCLGYDFSTPLNTLTTLTREYYKGNFDLYNYYDYYSPEFISQIPLEFNMNYGDFKYCIDKVIIYNSSLQKSNLETNNLQFKNINVISDTKIDDTHTLLRYLVNFNGNNDLNQPIEPYEDFAYFIKINNKWLFDVEPEFKDVMNQSQNYSICPPEIKRAVDLEKKLNLNVLYSSDQQRASFNYNNYRIGLWLSDNDYDIFTIGKVGESEGSIKYMFDIKDPISIRNIDDVNIYSELKQRLDYISQIAHIIDKNAPNKYFTVAQEDWQYLTINLFNINSDTLSISTQREYQQNETRYTENPMYRNVKPVKVTIDLTNKTLIEKNRIDQIKQLDKKFDQMERQRNTSQIVNYLKNNFLKLLLFFISTLLLYFILISLLTYYLKYFCEVLFKIILISFFISLLTTLLFVFSDITIFTILFSEFMVGSFGFIGGLFYGYLAIKVIGISIIVLLNLFLTKYLVPTRWVVSMLFSILISILLYYTFFHLNILGI